MPCGPICPASDALCIAGFKLLLLTTSPQADQLGTYPTRVKTHLALDLQRQPNMIYLDVRLQSMIFEMVLSKNTFCWKNSLAAYMNAVQKPMKGFT